MHRILSAIAAASALSAVSLHLAPGMGIVWGTSVSAYLALAAFSFVTVTALWMHRTAIHPYIFFIAAAGLFLGGRLFMHALGWPSPVFLETAFTPINLDASEAQRVVILFLSSMLAIHAGYVVFYRQSGETAIDGPAPASTNWQSTLALPAAALVLLCGPIAVYSAAQQLQVCFSEGYLGIYQESADYAGRWGSLSQYGCLLGLGLAMASGNRTVQLLAVAALMAVAVITFSIGIRSGLLSLALLLMWLAHKRVRKFGILPVVLAPILFFGLVQVANNFSCRATFGATPIADQSATPAIGGLSAALKDRTPTEVASMIFNQARAFAFNQGTSLLSVSVADSIPSYPWPAYVQSFIPGFGVAMRFLGQPLPLSDLYFGQHMARTWMPEQYANGEGFGWSIVSDFIAFSGGFWPVFLGLAAGFGFAFAALVASAQTSALWFGALAVILPKIVLLPRAGLYSIFPYLVTFGVVVVCWLLSKHLVWAITSTRKDA